MGLGKSEGSFNRPLLTTCLCLSLLLAAWIASLGKRDFQLKFGLVRTVLLPYPIAAYSNSSTQLTATAAAVLSRPKPTWTELAAAVVRVGVPHDVDPSPSLSSISSGVCWTLYQQATTADACMQLPTNQSITVLLCTSGSNSTGTLLIYDTSSGATAGSAAARTLLLSSVTGSGSSTSQGGRLPGNIYRVRLSGPEILQPPVHYCGNVAAAQYTVTVQGSYHLLVLQLYKGFTFKTPPFVLHDIWAASQHLQVDAVSEASTVTSGKSSPDNSTASPVCVPLWAAGANNSSTLLSSNSTNTNVSTTTKRAKRGINHKGRWVVAAGAERQKLEALQAAIQQSCVFKYAANPDGSAYYGCPSALQVASVPDIEDQPVLEWMPYNCRYSNPAVEFGSRCKAALQQQQKKVCFFGDSQTRHIYNQVLHLIEGAGAGYRKQISGNDRAYQVLQSDVMVYVADNYGNYSAINYGTSSCSHVFVNWGHWPLSFQETRPWTVDQYAQQVQRLAASMQQQQQRHRNRQFWLTSNPSPIADYHQAKTHIRNGIDWRTDPFLLLFNKVSSTIMQAHSIEIADTYSIASSLFDLSYDGSHYIGTVGMAQASMLVHAV